MEGLLLIFPERPMNASLLFRDRKGIHYDTKTEVTGGIQSDHIGP